LPEPETTTTEQEPVLRLKDERRFARLLSAEWASVVGDFVLLPVIPFAVYTLGGGTAQVAAVFGAEYIAMTFIVLFGGVYGDRLPRRRLMVVADLARFAVQVVVALMFFAGLASIWQLVLAQLFLGAAASFFRPALTAVVPQTVEPHNLQGANSARGIAAAMGTMVGPAIGGSAFIIGNPGWAYAMDAGTFLASALLLRGLQIEDVTDDQEDDEPSVIEGLREGWGEFRKRTWLWAIVAGFGVLNAIVFAPFYVLGPQVIHDQATWSTVLIWAGVGAIIGGVLMLRWQPDRPMLVATLAVALWTPLPMLLAGGASLALLSPAAALGGAGLAVFSALWETTLQSHVPDDQLARVSSYDWLGGLGLLPLGYVAAWGMGVTIGAAGGLFLGAAVLLVTTSTWMTVASIRHLRPVRIAPHTVEALPAAAS